MNYLVNNRSQPENIVFKRISSKCEMLVEVEEIIVDLLLMPKIYIHIKWRQYSRKEQTKHVDL